MAVRRGVVLVLVLVGTAVLVSITGIAVLYLALSRGPSVPSAATLVLRPGGELQEVVPDDILGQVLRRDGDTVRGFVDTLRRAASDPRVTSVLLVPSTLSLPYWAKLQELRDAILEFRKSGKAVVAFLEYGGDREYYLASAADRVYLVPTSLLDLTGVASYGIFLRGVLDKIGATPDFVHVGEYKTAPNQLTEKGFTPTDREMTQSLNQDAFAQLVRGIAEGRRQTEDQIRALIDQGPFVPKEALAAGLVDGLAYEDQMDGFITELRKDSGEVRRIEGDDYRKGSTGRSGRSRIAVLYAVGTITSGDSNAEPLGGAVVGSDTLVEQIREMRKDESIRAIVLRIDSPGGSSVASDVIWRELMITRDEKPSRPLVASMSDLAASGGYYIAMPAHVIVAQPGTLTGSIGVYGGKLAWAGALDKIGVTSETIKSGANADLSSPLAPFSPRQRERLQAFMQDFYDGFVAKAAEARKTTPDRIHTIAQGRVWTGRQALEQGLVDELGGLETAIALAKARAKIPEGEEVELVVYPKRRTLYEAFTEQFGDARQAGAWSLFAGSAEARAIAAVTSPVRLFRRGEPLALMPFAFVR